MKKKFKKEFVDDQFGIYNIAIKYHCWYGWITIKVLESEDYEKINKIADEILEKLNEEIY